MPETPIIEKFAELKVGDLVVITTSGTLATINGAEMYRIVKKTPATFVAGGRTWKLSKAQWGKYLGEYPAPSRHGVRRSVSLPSAEQQEAYDKETAEVIERCLGMLRAPETFALFAAPDLTPEGLLARWASNERRLERVLRDVGYETRVIREASERRAKSAAAVLAGAKS